MIISSATAIHMVIDQNAVFSSSHNLDVEIRKVFLQYVPSHYSQKLQSILFYIFTKSEEVQQQPI